MSDMESTTPHTARCSSSWTCIQWIGLSRASRHELMSMSPIRDWSLWLIDMSSWRETRLNTLTRLELMNMYIMNGSVELPVTFFNISFILWKNHHRWASFSSDSRELFFGTAKTFGCLYFNVSHWATFVTNWYWGCTNSYWTHNMKHCAAHCKRHEFVRVVICVSRHELISISHALISDVR